MAQQNRIATDTVQPNLSVAYLYYVACKIPEKFRDLKVASRSQHSGPIEDLY